MTKNIFRRILSIASALAIVFTAYPPVIFADDGGLCPHHPEHTAECGYVEGVSPCGFVCEICNPPEISDSPEPSDTPEPEVTTSPEEQPPVTTAPEPAETGTTAATPEESETLPAEPLPEPNFSPLALNGEHAEHDGINDWQAWSDSSSLPDTAGSYYLTTDVTLSDTWNVNGTVNLCLNGRDIEFSYGKIYVGIGNLTVYNCRGGCEIRSRDYSNLVDIYSGTFTLKDGVINSSYDTAISGESGSSIIIDGGGVIGEVSPWGGNIEVNGGKISGIEYGIRLMYAATLALSGDPIITGGIADIYLANGKTITIDKTLSATDISIQMETPGVFATGDYAAASKGCFVSANDGYEVTVIGNDLWLVPTGAHVHEDDGTIFLPWDKADSLPTSTGNWYLTKPVTLDNNWNITAGEIKLCLNGQTVNCGEAYSVSVSSGASLTVYDCSQGEVGIIKGERLTFISVGGSFTLESGKIVNDGMYGIAIDANGADVTINGGTVEALGAGFGMGIIATNSTVTVTGGVIKGGNSSEQDYGINFGGGTLNISGEPTIKGGTADIYLAEGDKITIDKPLTATDISIKMKTAGVFATGTCAAQSVNCFKSADPQYMVKVTDDKNGLELVEWPDHYHDGDQTEFKPWVSGDSLPTDPGNYYLTTDVTPTGDWNVPGEVNLCLNSKKITLEDYQIQVSTGDELTIYDCDQDDDAVQVSSNNNTINIDGNGTFTLNGGSLIGSDQAIYSDSESAVITINGGFASGMQKAVCAKNVTITGGSIVGVWDTGIDETTSLTLSGNPMITGGGGNPDIYINHEHPMTVSNLTNEEPYGIAMDSPGVFATVEGGSAEDYVDKFYSKDNKYAVVAEGDSLALVERHIHDGGEEFLPWDGISDLTEGKYYLTDNAELSYNTHFIKENITICLNGKTITCNEYGFLIQSGGSLTVCDCSNDKSGKIITTNETKVPINISSGNFTLESGTISAQNSMGSAIQVGGNGSGSSATINGGTVESANAAISASEPSSTVTVKGGEIKGGSGEQSYGIMSYAGKINISGGTITSSGDCAVRIYNYVAEEDPEYSILGGTLELSKNPNIEGVGADIQLDETSTLTIAESLTGGPYVLDGVADRVFAMGDGAEGSIGCFKLTDDLIAQGYVIVAENGELKAVVKHEHADGTNFDTKWDKDNELPTETGSYFLTKDVTLSANWDVSGDITLCLNGHKIDCGEDYYYIDVKPGGSLTVYDCEDGEGITGTGSQTVNVAGGKFTLESGKVYGSAYVIKAIENSTVTISGGELNGYYGGIESNGEVIIRGGQITNRDNGPGSYAVDIMKGGHLTLSGNPKFSETKTDISLSSTDKIEFDGELETTEPIKIDVALKNQAFTISAGENGVTAGQFKYVGSDDYEVQKVGAELWLVPKGAHVHEDDGTIFLPWDGSTTTLENGNYYLKDDVSLSRSLNISGNVELCLNGQKLECGNNRISVDNGSLTVYDCSEGKSGEIVSSAASVIPVNDGSVTINSGKITGALRGILGQDSTSTVIVNGGVITGTYGGIVSYGNLTVTDGTIISESYPGIEFNGVSFSLSGDPTIKGGEGVDISFSSPYSPPITINEKLGGGPYSIGVPFIDGEEPYTFATGDGAVDSIGCFKLAQSLIDRGYEIAAVDGTLVARLKTYTIKYESGEGSDISGKLFTETKTHGKNITISDKKFTRPGYTQIGWSTEQGASEVKYAFGADYTENANLTLYPVWEQNEIHFYKDGVEIHNLSLKVGDSVTVTATITPDEAVCDPIEWTVDGGISIEPGVDNTVTVTGDSAGEFKLTASTDDGQTMKTLTVTVTRSDSTVTAENKTVTYGENVTITATVEKAATNGISLMSLYDNKVTFKLGDKVLGELEVEGDTATLTISATRANGFAIGENTVTLEYSGSGALENVEGYVTVTVKPKTLTATITGTTTKTYDGNANAEGLKLELSGVVDGDTVTASAEFAYDSASAGERKISAEKAALTGEHAGYYELSAPIPTVSGKISPLAVELVWEGDEFVYDGTSHEVTAAVENVVGDDEFKLTYTENTATNAGKYTAKVTDLGNENYTLTGATGVEHEWKIMTLYLTNAQVEIVSTYTYNGGVQSPEIRVTIGGKELSTGDYTVTYSGEVKDAGKYTVTLTGTGNYSGKASTEFEIAPKSLTANISGTLNKVYDGTANVSNDVKIALTGVVEGDVVTATAEISYDSANAGTRKIVAKNITLSGEDAKNYTLSSNQAEVSGSITPAPIDLPNTEFIYGGEAKTVIQISGIDETVTATLTAFSSDAGEYEYSEVVKEGCYAVELSSENYKVQSAGTLTIKPLVAVLEWQSGKFTYDGTVHKVTATVKNAVTGDKFEIAYTGNTAANAGNYIAKVTNLGNANYTLEGANEHKWKITPRVAEIEWVGDEFTYDGKSHTVTAKVKNAVAGDKFEIAYTGNAATNAGDYTAKVTALGNANYTFEGANEHKWKITPRVADIEWIGSEFTYDGKSHMVTATVKNAVMGDKFEIAYTGNAGTKVGDYTAKVTALGNANYTLNGATDIEHNWKIAAAGQAAPEVKIDFINETLSTDETMEFSVDGETWQDCTAAMNVTKTGWNGSALTVKIRYKKDVDHIDGEIQNLVIPARRAAPDISEMAVSKSQTEISIAEIPGCEYSLDGAAWQDSGSFGGLDKGATYKIHVRYKANASAFASFVTSKTVVTSSTSDGTTELLPGETVTAGDGSIKNLGGEIIIDDGAGNVTTVTLPDGGSVEVDEQGCVTIPDGGEVAVGDNPAVSLPDGGKVEPDGTVTADEVKVGDTDVKGENVTVAPDGNITVPGEGQVKVGDNPEIILPTGGTVEPDGTVTADEVKVGDTDVKGNDVTVSHDGNITVPGEGQVKVGDNPEIILPTGGTVEPDGTVTADEVKVGDTDVKGEDVTVAPDGIITLSEGGKVSADGEPEKILPAGTIIENGEINAPAIAEPADGTGSLGDSIILKIESADERLETSDRENLKDAANAIVREVYDIELLKNGIEVEPDRSIKLTVSADVSGAKMKVFMLNDGGKFNEIDAEFDAENGTFSVVTGSLGIFILASEEGQISAEVVASGGAPEVEISDDDRKILEENLFTDEDEAAIENGDNVKVVMNVEGVSEEDVSADNLDEIEAFLDDLEGCEVAEYADITLTKITEDGVTGDEIRSEAISEINNPIKLVIDIPESLHKVGRIFSVIRLHDGKAELLSDTDQSDETVTILTDKFSLYVLIYRDPASQPSHVHSFTAWINVGEGGHLARCAICGKVMSLMPHTMLNGVCTACGYSAIFSQPLDESDVIEIEVPTEGMIANEEVVEF